MDSQINAIDESNYFDAAMPQGYIDSGMENVGVLVDGKDFVTDSIRYCSFLNRSQYSDKMKASAARVLAWTLPCGLCIERTALCLGRVSEKRLVEMWGRQLN
jgi:hypothetical protein